MSSSSPVVPQGFFGRLFDFSFESFVTPSLIKLIYALLVLFAALGALVFVLAAFASSAAAGVLVLILAPLIFLLYVIMGRVYLEVVVVLFRIAEHTAEMAANGRHGGTGTPPA